MRILNVAAVALLVGGSASMIGLPQAQAQIVTLTVNVAPPPLPIYVQPAIPEPGYLWSPGYWAWDDVSGYFWVPGTWVLPPRPGLLWTPGYWGWDNSVYTFHTGYWGPHVGFYGGVAYGYGYTGAGYEGGYWNNGAFFYNRTVNNITNINITNVYTKTVVINNTVNNVSFNGGPRGIPARPTPEQVAAAQEPHIAPTPVQTQHLTAAKQNPALFLTANHGRPPVAATARPADFKGPGVVPSSARTPVVATPPTPAAGAGLPRTDVAKDHQLPVPPAGAGIGASRQDAAHPAPPLEPKSGAVPGHSLPVPPANTAPASARRQEPVKPLNPNKPLAEHPGPVDLPPSAKTKTLAAPAAPAQLRQEQVARPPTQPSSRPQPVATPRLPPSPEARQAKAPPVARLPAPHAPAPRPEKCRPGEHCG